jgi:hypothetical protein
VEQQLRYHGLLLRPPMSDVLHRQSALMVPANINAVNVDDNTSAIYSVTG